MLAIKIIYAPTIADFDSTPPQRRCERDFRRDTFTLPAYADALPRHFYDAANAGPCRQFPTGHLLAADYYAEFRLHFR